MDDLQIVPVRKPVLRIPSFSQIVAYPIKGFEFLHHLSLQKKVLLFSFTSLTIVGLTARYFRRRKRRKASKHKLTPNDIHKPRKYKTSTCTSSGEVDCASGNVSPGFHRSLHRQSSFSISSDKSISNVQKEGGDAESILTPQQFGVMGMEALETAISFWEDALSVYNKGNTSGNNTLTSQEEAEFISLLQEVIDEAYTLQDRCEHLFLHQHSVLFRSASVTPVPSEYNVDIGFDRRTLTSISSVESFVSCQGDIAVLTDLEEFEDGANFPLYTAALKYHEEQNILYRDVRTEWVQCNSDLEYICKVHCIRYACQFIFSNETNKKWFIEAGKEIIGNLLASAHKDPKDALVAYDELLDYLENCNKEEMAAELELRGVKAITFYDVVLDFILMDAFEDLENPPSSVIAVVQNRWLSNGFKESALSTAVWSVVKAKRRLLKYQDGFLSHFYDISEHISPMLAWGFLGPNQALKDLCLYFKDQIQGLLQDMFSFSAVRYTTIEELSEDILSLTTERYKQIIEKLILE